MPLRTVVALLSRKFMRNRPARSTRDESEPLLPIDAVDLIDDAIDVVVELGALSSISRWKAMSSSVVRQSLVSGLVLKPQDSNHLIMPDCVSAGMSLISPHA